MSQLELSEWQYNYLKALQRGEIPPQLDDNAESWTELQTHGHLYYRGDAMALTSMAEQAITRYEQSQLNAVDASAPGVFSLGYGQLFNLGGGLWFVVARDAGDAEVARRQLKAMMPDATILAAATTKEATYTPFDKSADLVTLIRNIIKEELTHFTEGTMR